MCPKASDVGGLVADAGGSSRGPGSMLVASGGREGVVSPRGRTPGGSGRASPHGSPHGSPGCPSWGRAKRPARMASGDGSAVGVGTPSGFNFESDQALMHLQSAKLTAPEVETKPHHGIDLQGLGLIQQIIRDNRHDASHSHSGGVLCLSDMVIRPRSATALALELRSNTTIASLDLSSNVIGDAGATAMAAALQTNSMLETLELGSNGISTRGAECIGSALVKNCTLKFLELSFNGLGDEGATLLAGMLPQNSTLQHLGLGFNGILEGGGASLSKALDGNSSLESLELSYNALQDAGTAVIARVLPKCKLQTLGLSSNGITDAGATALAEALESPNCCLSSLGIASNCIGDVGATRLAQALAVNTSVESMYLEENDITEEGGKALQFALDNTCKVAEMHSDLKLAVAMGQHPRLARGTGLYSLDPYVMQMIVTMCQERTRRSIIFYPKEPVHPGMNQEEDIEA